jgi:hypothetical protein
MGLSGQRHAPAALYLHDWTPNTHRIGGWVGLRAGLDTGARGKILFLCWGSNADRPVCSQTERERYESFAFCLMFLEQINR